MEKLMIEDGHIEGGYMPKALCSIGRDGMVDDCDSCSEYCEAIENNCHQCAINEVFKRLTEYEKTGLDPQQIVEMDKLYHEKCEELARFEPIKTDDATCYDVHGQIELEEYLQTFSE